MTTILSTWGIPSTEDLIRQLKKIANAEDAAARSLAAVRSGVFVDPEGRRDELEVVRNPLQQIAVVCWLAQRQEQRLSVEVGFGMGCTASCILSARRMMGADFEHIIFDPFGLPGGRGEVTENYLRVEFGDLFQRQRRRSTIGLAALLEDRGQHSAGLIMIDGDHHFDAVMADFQIADLLLAVGGFMVLDDAAYPAPQTLIHFIRSNRPDYEVSLLEVANTAVIRKVGSDERPWDHFIPFEVPARSHWQRDPLAASNRSEDWLLLE